MANYAVDPAFLNPFLPANTVLDYRNGLAYLSLVGFMFRDVRLRGVRVPFHAYFPEVNLRFYVRHNEKRGIVFMSEIVPKPALCWVANTIYREHYRALPMKSSEEWENENLHCCYQWKHQGRWNGIEVKALAAATPLREGSDEEFITEHFWGYAAGKNNQLIEYEVKHPRWDIYPVKEFHITCAFSHLYGKDFDYLDSLAPQSVFLAKGSPVEVFTRAIKPRMGKPAGSRVV